VRIRPRPLYLERLHTFDLLVNLVKQAADATQGKFNGRARRHQESAEQRVRTRGQCQAETIHLPAKGSVPKVAPRTIRSAGRQRKTFHPVVNIEVVSGASCPASMRSRAPSLLDE